MKNCFKCGVDKPFSDFYTHNKMADGFLGKCKECTKYDVLKHRGENIERIRKYDRERGSRQSKGYLIERRRKYPNQYKAQTMVGNAIRDGKLHRQPCEVCGEARVNAHHNDYLKPLNVRWLCYAHHHQWHRDNGDGLNK